ncbi:hypothetical protein GIB67_015804 [Kingdonia uniflora]|uniref:3'-5' exonuclease domain-containing protein n=1 Tax=Kingdonia uniflora TaxID=39325 RepID=A0A7J7NV40_9MAGN|nr:hypothetical protein GIB67_015804 [Kingdonia uniflora]
MAISIIDLELSADTHQTYIVTLFNDDISTTLTHTPSIVDQYISETLTLHQSQPPNSPLIVGLDVEWRPSFNRQVEYPIAIIQLCVDHRCLIFQLVYTTHIPQSLIDFLGNPGFTFVGVGIEEDLEKLLLEYELRVKNKVDLRGLAAEKMGVKELKKAGLKGLAKEVLGIEVEKPKRVTMSRWDSEYLDYAQIQYACVDAFLSFEIGRRLISGS